MQVIDLCLIIGDTKLLHDLVEKVGDPHTQQIAQLFGSVESGQQRVTVQQESLCPYKVGTEYEGDLVTDVNDECCLVGIGVCKKIEHGKQENELNQQRDTKEPFGIEYGMVKTCHNEHTDSKQDPAKRVDGRLQRPVEYEDDPYAQSQKEGVHKLVPDELFRDDC